MRMKSVLNFVFASIGVSAVTSLASAQTLAPDVSRESLKVCKTVMSPFDKPELRITSVFEIVRSGTETQGVITQTDGTQSASQTQEVTISEMSVRAGLSAQSNLDDPSMNVGEKLLIHALKFESDPQMKKMFSSGIELGQVRQAKLFIFKQKPETIGLTVLIEAKDAAGKDLGTFLGGFLVLPCQL